MELIKFWNIGVENKKTNIYFYEEKSFIKFGNLKEVLDCWNFGNKYKSDNIQFYQNKGKDIIKSNAFSLNLKYNSQNSQEQHNKGKGKKLLIFGMKQVLMHQFINQRNLEKQGKQNEEITQTMPIMFIISNKVFYDLFWRSLQYSLSIRKKRRVSKKFNVIQSLCSNSQLVVENIILFKNNYNKYSKSFWKRK
ncbi:unnamed protein product [Paramecium sonneborni]|uniref:Uncharacterized protein n=1 Tax=Paramecium sonneborni TaxID=65129 RepID=A0A8S1QWB5_9CILI|nr:unnamed protein product [Paramecium sonneborni]